MCYKLLSEFIFLQFWISMNISCLGYYKTITPDNKKLFFLHKTISLYCISNNLPDLIVWTKDYTQQHWRLQPGTQCGSKEWELTGGRSVGWKDGKAQKNRKGGREIKIGVGTWNYDSCNWLLMTTLQTFWQTQKHTLFLTTIITDSQTGQDWDKCTWKDHCRRLRSRKPRNVSSLSIAKLHLTFIAVYINHSNKLCDLFIGLLSCVRNQHVVYGLKQSIRKW